MPKETRFDPQAALGSPLNIPVTVGPGKDDDAEGHGSGSRVGVVLELEGPVLDHGISQEPITEEL